MPSSLPPLLSLHRLLLLLLLLLLPSAAAPSSATCPSAFAALCGAARRSSTGDCLVCVTMHQHQLEAAGCRASQFDQLCAAGSAVGLRSHACLSQFMTEADSASLRWDAITDLGQTINPLYISASGAVEAANPPSWPQQDWILAAHGNHTRITVSLHPVSKAAAASFLAQPDHVLVAAAHSAADMAVRAGYDGLQLDWEGLKPASRPGFERLVSLCATALRQLNKDVTLSVTLYSPKLVAMDATVYNVSTLSRLAEFVFVMGCESHGRVAPVIVRLTPVRSDAVSLPQTI